MRWYLLISIFFFTPIALAKLQWREPQVMSEAKNGNRVIRFSGNTKPNGQVRITNNKIRLYLDDGSAKDMKINHSDQQQFPVVADGNGDFIFDLELPTGAIELPVKYYDGEDWRASAVNFRVPSVDDVDEDGTLDIDDGNVSEFDAEEEMEKRHLRRRSEYKKDRDEGQVIKRRRNGPLSEEEEGPVSDKHDLRAFIGLGAAAVSLTEKSGAAPVNTTPGLNLSESELVLPSWHLGLVYRYSSPWRFAVDYRHNSVNLDPGNIPTAFKQIGDRSWSILKFNASYFRWKKTWGLLGVDGGLQMQSVPFLRLQPASSIWVYNNSSVMLLQAGIRAESAQNRQWPWEAYGSLLYGLSSSSAFNLNSGFAVELGGGITRELIPNYYFGIFSELQYHLYDTEFTSTATYQTDYNLLLLAVEGRIIIRF